MIPEKGEEQWPIQGQYQLSTQIGKITVQSIILKHYMWLILTESSNLISGSLQLSMQTPYSNKPTVLDIGADENQAQNQQFCMKLCKQFGMPVILSDNLSVKLGVKDQIQVMQVIKRGMQKIAKTNHTQDKVQAGSAQKINKESL